MDAKSPASSRSMNSDRISKKKWMAGAWAAMRRRTSLARARSKLKVGSSTKTWLTPLASNRRSSASTRSMGMRRMPEPPRDSKQKSHLKGHPRLSSHSCPG